MKILVTGAYGFLGRECVIQLTSRGHAVITTDRHGEVNLVGDLSDPKFCKTLPDVDTVIHAAAVQYLSKDLPLLKRRSYFYRNNILATKHLCARYSGQSSHFIMISSSMVYRQCGLGLYHTSSNVQEQGVYSWSKICAQSFVDYLENPTATVIPCIIGGPGREGLFRSFIATMTRYRLVIIPGTGKQLIHMVHVKDVAALITLITENRSTGRYNAAAPQPLSIDRWIDEIEDQLNLRAIKRLRLPLLPVRAISALSRYRLLAKEQVLMLGQPHVLSIDESTELGWEPRYSNAMIVREIALYINAI